MPIDLTAVLVAALAAFIIGFMFHGPLFGKIWMKLAKIHPTGNEKLKDMWKQMLMNLAANLVTAYVIAMVYVFAVNSLIIGEPSAYKGSIIAFWMWLGFVVTSTSMDPIWMGRSWKLWMFECASSLFMFIAMGAIIAGW
jgi:hypothetical protein